MNGQNHFVSFRRIGEGLFLVAEPSEPLFPVPPANVGTEVEEGGKGGGFHGVGVCGMGGIYE